MLQGGHAKVNRRTDGQTDRQTGWIQYTPPNFVAGGIKNNTDFHQSSATEIFCQGQVKPNTLEKYDICVSKNPISERCRCDKTNPCTSDKETAGWWPSDIPKRYFTFVARNFCCKIRSKWYQRSFAQGHSSGHRQDVLLLLQMKLGMDK